MSRSGARTNDLAALRARLSPKARAELDAQMGMIPAVPIPGIPLPLPRALQPMKPALRQRTTDGMNKTERAFFAFIKAHHGINAVHIKREGAKLRLANGCVYNPDFVAFFQGRSMAWEVKGFMRDDAAVKIKVAATTFPNMEFYLAFRDKQMPGGFRVERVWP